jgi:hypothetical protein
MDSKEALVVERQIHLAAQLQKDLEEASERIRYLEETNTEQRKLVWSYRLDWMNECRHTEALKRLGPAPSFSQAEWFESSPDRSYSTSLAYPARSWN